MPTYSSPHSRAIDGLAVLHLWDYSFPGFGDSTGMSRLIVLRIGILSYVPRYLSYGVDFTKGLSRSSSGVVALCRRSDLFRCVLLLSFLFSLVGFWFGSFCACGLWALCLSGWLGWFFFFLLPNAFRIIACNTWVLYGFELARLPCHLTFHLLLSPTHLLTPSHSR